jgi:hypothetical protein
MKFLWITGVKTHGEVWREHEFHAGQQLAPGEKIACILARKEVESRCVAVGTQIIEVPAFNNRRDRSPLFRFKALRVKHV